MNLLRRISKLWQQISLARQFALAGSAMIVISMLTIGFWTSKKIEQGVTQNTAAATALYVNSFVSPLIQELSHKNNLSTKSREALDRLFTNTELGKRIKSFKIWKENGRIVYASNASLIGWSFPPTSNLKKAWRGIVAAELDLLEDPEDALEKAIGVPLLEVYAPVREKNSDRIIAVAEFYAIAETVQSNLLNAKFESWVVVSILTLGTIVAISGIVRRGSRTIALQRKTLEQRVNDLTGLLSQNEKLRTHVEQASQRTAVLNEQFLRRVSAELHDGPAQLLGLALLRLDSFTPLLGPGKSDRESPTESIEYLRTVLADALLEIRNLSAGLALPEIEDLSLDDTLKIVVRSHEKRTDTSVKCDFSGPPVIIPHSIKTCLYRFTQEALNNAFMHAKAEDQNLHVSINGTHLQVQVSDNGKGFDPSTVNGSNGMAEHRLGLTGMHERIRSLGGVFTIYSSPGKGTRVTAAFPVSKSEK